MIPPNKGKGKAIAWLRAHLTYEGDDCIQWPFSSSCRGQTYVSLDGRIYRAARLMCELAHGAPPSPEHECAHSCGHGHLKCMNPRHLSWKTRSENQRDRMLHGTQRSGRRYKLKPHQVAKIRELEGRKTRAELATMFGVNESNIRQIHKQQIWTKGPVIITDDQVRSIRLAALETKTLAKVSKEHGVKRGVVWRIWHGRSYQHVT